ncbi:MAG: hypothetical protein GY811_20435 [Myxococcales bacterium]|nr:hypothetical protein [Myxococcales bacterium]
MDYETLKWIRMIHLYAILSWVGALIGISFILRQHAKAAEGAYKDFIELEKGTAITMDISATIAMICGFAMLFSISPSPLKGQGWMHAKLFLVVVLAGIHGMQRMRVGKYKRGNVTAEPGWLIPVVEIAALGIIVLASARPF